MLPQINIKQDLSNTITLAEAIQAREGILHELKAMLIEKNNMLSDTIKKRKDNKIGNAKSLLSQKKMSEATFYGLVSKYEKKYDEMWKENRYSWDEAKVIVTIYRKPLPPKNTEEGKEYVPTDGKMTRRCSQEDIEKRPFVISATAYFDSPTVAYSYILDTYSKAYTYGDYEGHYDNELENIRQKFMLEAFMKGHHRVDTTITKIQRQPQYVDGIFKKGKVIFTCQATHINKETICHNYDVWEARKLKRYGDPDNLDDYEYWATMHIDLRYRNQQESIYWNQLKKEELTSDVKNMLSQADWERKVEEVQERVKMRAMADCKQLAIQRCRYLKKGTPDNGKMKYIYVMTVIEDKDKLKKKKEVNGKQ